MGFDGNGSARGAIQYAFDCIGPRIGIGSVDARLTEIGHAANAPRHVARCSSASATQVMAPVDNRGRKARVWRPRPNPQAATCARPRWFEAECGKARAERLKVRLDQGPGRDAGGQDQTRRPWAGGYDYLRGRSANTAPPARARPRPCRSPGPSPSRSTRRCPTRPSSGSCAVSRRRRHRQARPPSDESALRAAPSSRRTPAN